MSLPTPSAIGKAVVMTAVSLVILKVAKQYLPPAVGNLIPL